MRVIWITGAGGLIGNALSRTAPEYCRSFTPRSLTRDDLDLTDSAAVSALFRKEQPAAIIHCAAISKSPACQANPAAAWKMNVEATERLADLAVDRHFVFLSTDLIFDGLKGLYIETDASGPRSVYAETKVAAEEWVRRHPNHLIIRTSLNGGVSPTRDRGFNEEMQRVWRMKRPLNLFVDEFRSPIAAVVTARAIWELVEQQASGILHIAGSERLSRWEIGQLVAECHPELDPQIHRGFLKDYDGPPRSPDTSLNCDKAQALLSFRLPGLREWLAQAGNVL